MGRIISISNQKGGVGKSTTAINLSACLAELHKKVLTIDLDPQGNTSSGFGIDRSSGEKTVYELLIGEAEPEECIVETAFDGLKVIPSTVELAGVEIELLDVEDKEYLLKNKMGKLWDNFDFVIIDCPPSLSVLTLNALCASNGVIIPIQCEYYALEGLTQILKTVKLVQERLNPELKIDGIVFTMFDGRNNLSSDVVANVKENLDIKVYDTIIPRNVRLAEAPSYGLPINFYDERSTGAESYRFLAKEVIRKGRK